MTHKWLAPLIAAVAWAAPAAAVNLHVSPSGSGTTCTPGSPCALSTANSQARPGDVIYLADGVYSSTPVPGQSGTAAAPITYMGNPSDTGAVHVRGGSIGRNHVVLRYLKFTSGVDFSITAQRIYGIKMRKCTVSNSIYMAAPWNCKLDSVRIHPNFVNQSYFTIFTYCGAPGGTGEKPAAFDTVSNCYFYLNTGLQENASLNKGTLWSLQCQGDLANQDSAWVQDCVFEKMRVECVLRSEAAPDPPAGARGVYLYSSRRNIFRDCKWTIHDSTAVGSGITEREAYRTRTWVRGNTFLRDTVLVTGRTGRITFSTASGVGGSNEGCQIGNNRYEQCYFKNTATNSPWEPIMHQYGMCGDTLSRCVFVANFANSGIGAYGTDQLHGGNNVIDHCDFFTTSTSAPPLFLGLATGSFATWAPTATLKVTNNIFYMPSTSTANNLSGAFYQLWAGRTYTINNNLYSYYGRNSTNGDRSIRYQYNCSGPGSAGCTGAQFSRPGTGGSFYSTTGQDGNAVYGSPVFVDSAMSNFDPHLTASSAALRIDTSGGDAGAYPFSASGPDIVPPAPVADLDTVWVNDAALVLKWTAVGDDAMVGTAAAYDLRRSTQPITTANFASATPVGGVPNPSAPGSLEAHALSGLTPGTTYYFRLRTRDEANNWSTLSNERVVTTSTFDRKAPSRVTNLGDGP